MTGESARALRIATGTFCLGIAVVAALNFVVNPLSYYRPRFFQPLVDSSRDFKTHQMRELSPQVSILILGSSRTEGLPPGEIERLTHQVTYNGACDGSKAEDYLALTRFAVEACHWPLRQVIIGLDLDAFHSGVPPHVELVGATLLQPYLPPDLRPDLTTPLRALLAWDQTNSSVLALRYSLTTYPPKAREFDARGLEVHPSGDAEDERRRREGTYHPMVHAVPEDWFETYRTFNRLLPARVQAFRDLARYTSERGIRVLVYLTPLHHTVVSSLETGENFPRVYADALDLLRDIQRRYPTFTYRDYVDAAAFGGDPENFYADGAHARRENLFTIARALAGDGLPTR